MAARMDGENYGELVAYEMPSRDLPDGPNLASATISADETVSELENLLGRGGSEIRKGNMLLVPIDNALLYVQPYYVVAEGETRQLPRLERVVAVFDDEVVIENTLAEALASLFGQQTTTQEQPDAPSTAPDADADVDAGADADGDAGTTTGTVSERAATLLAEADALFDEAEASLREDGDIGAYQDKIQEANAKVDEAIALLQDGEGGDSGDGGGSDGTTTTSTTAPSG
jgi:uncharacterized protein